MRRTISVLALGFAIGAVLLAQSDLFEWSLYASLNAGQRVAVIAFSPDGSKGAFATAGGAVQIFDLAGRPRSSRNVAQQRGRITSLAFASDGSAVMSAGEDGNVVISPISGGGGRTIRTKGRLVSAALSRDGTLLATAADDKSVTVWDIQSGRQLSQLRDKSKKPFFALSFAEKDTSLIGVSESGAICEWDVKTRQVLRQTQDSDQSIHSASIAGSAGLLAIGTEFADFQKGGFAGPARPTDIYREDRIKIYDLGRGSIAKTLDGINGDVVALALSPDGRFVGFARQAMKDSFLVVYDTERGVEVASTRVPGIATTVAFSRQGQWLATATASGDVLTWAVKGVINAVGPSDLRGAVYTITSTNNEPLVNFSRPLTLAVMDFLTNSLDPAIGRAVADMVRAQIGGGQNVKVVERAQMEQIMKEQNFQNSDRADTASAARLGRILGAGKMVLGTVSKLDARLTLDVRMVDVETAVIDGSREITCEPCTASGLQEGVIRLRPVLVK